MHNVDDSDLVGRIPLVAERTLEHFLVLRQRQRLGASECSREYAEPLINLRSGKQFQAAIKVYRDSTKPRTHIDMRMPYDKHAGCHFAKAAASPKIVQVRKYCTAFIVSAVVQLYVDHIWNRTISAFQMFQCNMNRLSRHIGAMCD